jgi:small subunit ribosomal protein S16
MVKIRLARHGTKKRPFYRIVAAHGEKARNGRFLEILGTFDPRAAENQVNLKPERIQYWLGKGAQPSPTVKQLLKKHLKAA